MTEKLYNGILMYVCICVCLFVASHEVSDLDRPRVADLKDYGADILCWTVKSADQEIKARKVAQNITFEQYLAKPVA